jgi:hypothetical protein
VKTHFIKKKIEIAEFSSLHAQQANYPRATSVALVASNALRAALGSER